MKRIVLILLQYVLSTSYAYTPMINKDVSGKSEISCSDVVEQAHNAIILTLGQSNAANSGGGGYKVRGEVFNIFRGKCYIANDPLLDTTGVKGSVWGRLADRLIDSGIYDKIFIKSIAIGGSPMVSWTQQGVGRIHGNYFQRVVEAVRELDSLDLGVTHILWHQGEQDMSFGTTTEQYKDMFLDMLEGIRRLGVKAPIYVARASFCQGRESSRVIRAQNELIEEYDDIFQGPNTDLINLAKQRIDSGCHFSEIGLDEHALQWSDLIIKNESKN